MAVCVCEASVGSLGSRGGTRDLGLWGCGFTKLYKVTWIWVGDCSGFLHPNLGTPGLLWVSLQALLGLADPCVSLSFLCRGWSLLFVLN